MRIGISTSVVQRGKGGVGQYLFAVLRALLPYAGAHSFHLFVLEEDLPLFGFTEGKMDLIALPEKYRPPIKNILWHQSVLPPLARCLSLDVLHVPSYRRMLWPRPCPLVATIHDLAPFRLSGKYDWKRMFYGRVVVRRLAHRQNQIMAVSNATAADIRQFFKVPAHRISVVHNGVDHERFVPGPKNEAQLAVAQKLGVTKPFFLYIARFEHPAKNHVRLIRAFEEFRSRGLADWQLVLAGSDWHGAEFIHEAIAKSPFRADIRSLGFVPDAALPELYRAAEAFVYPSLFEGFGMPAIEAMASGCPVICSTSGSLGEVVGDAAAIVIPEEIHSIARALEKIAADREYREQLKVAGLKRAALFDWRHAAEQALAVYARAAQPESAHQTGAVSAPLACSR